MGGGIRNLRLFLDDAVGHGCFKTEIKNEISSNSWENLTK